LPARIDQFAVKGSDRIDCLSVCSLLQDSSLLVAGSRIVIYILYLVSTMMLGFHILGVRTVEAAAYCHLRGFVAALLWCCVVGLQHIPVEKASLTPPGSRFRAPSRLILSITDYLSLLPTFPGSDNCTQGVLVPWYG
jgi:hypothetical protein